MNAPVEGDRYILGERSGWELSGREVEVVAVRQLGRWVVVRLGEWHGGDRARAADAMVLPRREWDAMIKGATKIARKEE